MSTPTPRWFTHADGHSEFYRDRFRELAAQGADLSGEARFVDMLIPRNSRVLDAGCGGGRLAGALAQAGHLAFGIDVDPVLVAAAEEDYPGPIYQVRDLTELSLADLAGDPVAVTVCAGNVLVFAAPGTERELIRHLIQVTAPGGRVVLGFRRDEAYPYERFDADLAVLAEQTGVSQEFRFGTWHLDPFTDESDFAVTVLRVAG